MTELRADCARCAGLCCVVLPFAASVDFAADKPAGVPCHHLQTDARCGIHDRLRESGYRGCTVYDCHGAGQRVTARIGDLRARPELVGTLTAVFPVVRQLHELLVHLTDALSWPAAAPMHQALRDALRHTDALADEPAERLTRLDIAGHRADVATLLRRASLLVRGPDAADRSGRDLLGAALRGADLRRTGLRGALLIAADLRGADLRGTDLLGADLRDTDLRGADLRGALFLVQAQLDAALGDADTRIDERFNRPGHWRA